MMNPLMIQKEKSKKRPIPTALVYEVLNGIQIPYAGYKKALNALSKNEQLMGYGMLQGLIIDTLATYLKLIFAQQGYRVLGLEMGLHVDKNNNFSLDIAIFPQAALSLQTASVGYIDFPPNAVIEVDTKADPGVAEQMDYYHTKTQSLLDFGVGEVLWIFTHSRKIMHAKANQPWIIVNWTDEVAILGHTMVIDAILADDTATKGL
jgi:Uma2 family endonuclease